MDASNTTMASSPAPPSCSSPQQKATPFLLLVCASAACGGLLFGYDLGISGGVTAMDDFLEKFFPEVYRKRHGVNADNYCLFDSQLLTAFTSSLYLATLLTSLLGASSFTRTRGRKASICVGGVFFLLGSALAAGALNLPMLISGRVALGIGLGFTNQAIPLYLAEMATVELRGALTTMFQIAITIGGTVAFLVNYGTGHIVPYGWRLSLGLAFVPALFITMGSVVMPDSPSSLVQRKRLEDALRVLQKIRGTEDVHDELEDIIRVVEASETERGRHWRDICTRKYRPQLVMAFSIPFFQQVTGINLLTFYSPVLFQTLGFGSDAALYSAVILGALSTTCNIIIAFILDKIGRRKLFLYGGSTMLLSLVLIGLLFQWKLGDHNAMPKGFGILSLVLICLYCIFFSISWGPLTWVVPSEIFPLEIRSIAQSINISVLMFFIFATAQTFLAMLCHLKATLFFFFAGWVFVMTVFIYALFPETGFIPLDAIAGVWKQHPFWKRYYT